jgi:AcrR family transcriptional regulator
MSASQTHSRLLKKGLQTLSREGLAGVTIGRLAASAKLSKSGFFAHFESKQQLQIELLNATAALAQKHVVAPALAHPEGLPRLRALAEGWLGWSKRAGLAGGCPIAAALFELDDLGGEVRGHVAALEREWRDLLLAHTSRAIALGHLSVKSDPKQIVWELCGIYLSHHASVRFLHDPAADGRAEIAIKALFDRNGAAAGSGGRRK